MAVHLLTCAPDHTARTYLAQLDHTDVLVLLTPPGPELTLPHVGGPRLYSLVGHTKHGVAIPLPHPHAQPITAEQLVELIAQDGPAITWGS